MIEAVKDFFKPLMRKRFWVGLVASIVMIPATCIVPAIIFTFDMLSRPTILETTYNILSFCGLILWLPAFFCLAFGVPTYLIYEYFKLRSKWYYACAGFIAPSFFEFIFLGYINIHSVGFGFLGFASAFIFWRIAVKPLEKK